MPGTADGLVVAAATWVALAAAGYLACLLARVRRLAPAVAAVVLGVAATAGGVASADGSRPRPPVRPSLGWVVADGSAGHRNVVVRPGDCLWAITARELRDPNAARIAASWPRWWHRNRRVIGPDPNLIHPGQRLRRPGPTPRRH